MRHLTVLLLAVTLLCGCGSPSPAAILVQGANGTYAVKTTLAAAAVAPDAAGKTVVVTSALSAVQSNISSATLHAWPADRTLRVAPGGSIGNTTTFRYTGDTSQWQLQQVFAGTGAVTLGATSDGYPDYFQTNTTPGTTDMTAGVTKAIAALPSGSVLRFRPTTYKVSSTGTDIFTISKNISLAGTRNATTIVGYVTDTANNIFNFSVTSNNGNGDVRGQSVTGIGAYFAGSTLGASSVYVEGVGTGVLPQFEFTVSDCSLQGVWAHAVVFHSTAAFSNIVGNTLENGVGFLHKCADGQRVLYNNIFGSMQTGIVFDIEFGSYSHLVQGNVITTKKGQIRILNGSQIKIVYNQFEQYPGYGVNDSPYAAQITVGEAGGTNGADYQSVGVTIEDNNIGGGSNVAHGIMVLNCSLASIDKNIFPGVTTSTFVNFATGAYSSNNYLGDKNLFGGVPADGEVFSSASSLNYGVAYSATGITFVNGWSATATMTYVLKEDGTVSFRGAFVSGTATTGTVIATLPVGLRPTAARYLTVGTGGVPGSIRVDTNGEVVVLTLAAAAAYLDGITMRL